jgi:hypothetical protein
VYVCVCVFVVGGVCACLCVCVCVCVDGCVRARDVVVAVVRDDGEEEVPRHMA